MLPHTIHQKSSQARASFPFNHQNSTRFFMVLSGVCLISFVIGIKEQLRLKRELTVLESSQFIIPVKVAGVFNRSLQRLSEQVSSSPEVTEFNQSTLRFFNELQMLNNWCMKIISQLDSLIHPNPAYRLSNTFVKVITKGKSDVIERRKCGESVFGSLLNEGVSLVAMSGSGQHSMSSQLQSMSTLQVELGQKRETFIQALKNDIVVGFGETTKVLNRLVSLRKGLEDRRLDVDFAKRKLRNATDSSSIDRATELLDDANDSFNSAIDDFEKQCHSEIPIIRKDITEMTVKFMKLQQNYFKECASITTMFSKSEKSAPPPVSEFNNNDQREAVSVDESANNAFSI